MISLGGGEFACAEDDCGAVVYLRDAGAGDGPSTVSKPSTAQERSENVRLAHERGQATRRFLEALAP